MKETEQTLLDQIKNDVAKENGGYKYHRSILNDEFWKIVCERYYQAKAKASCEATLKKASENAELEDDPDNDMIDYGPSTSQRVNKFSITDPSNIVIL